MSQGLFELTELPDLLPLGIITLQHLQICVYINSSKSISLYVIRPRATRSHFRSNPDESEVTQYTCKCLL
jgi:hypothetical protein